MSSRPFRALERREHELRVRLLPDPFSQIGKYTTLELDLARAYRILICAEIEHFLEDRATELADAAFSAWKNSHRASRPLVACLANVVGNHTGLPKSIDGTGSVTTMAGKILAQYKHAIKTNHGIRTENVLGILLPIGVLETEIDPVWLSTIDGFGARRGVAAHTRAISYAIDPQDDHNTVKQIISGLKEVDDLIGRLRRSI